MWSSLIEEANVLRDEALKMVQQFAPQSADKALSESIHVRCPDRGTSDLCAAGLEHGREPSAQLGITIDHQHFGVGVQRCISRLLRTPLVGRRSGDGSTDDSAPLEIDEEQDEDGAEERVEGLHEVARPGNVVAEESAPALAAAWESPLHISLHRALRHADSKLEQLTPHPLGAPARVSRGHLANERGVAC